ncbi:helix-turn-helix transcriptional regulator [Vibrio astriarenae]
METIQELRIIRKPEALLATGLKSSTFHNQINQGLMVKPVNLGARSSGYPLHEINMINAARIAGKNDCEIKELVSKLMSLRQKLLN